VVRVPGYRSRGPGFSSRRYKIFWVVGLVRGPLSLVSTTEELLDRNVAAPVYKTENTAVGIRPADHATTLYPKKGGINFVDKRRSLGRYSSWSLVFIWNGRSGKLRLCSTEWNMTQWLQMTPGILTQYKLFVSRHSNQVLHVASQSIHQYDASCANSVSGAATFRPVHYVKS
jgi:hypothetical protein